MKEHYKNAQETYRGQKDQEGDDWTYWLGLDIVQILASLRRLKKLLYAISLS